MDRPAAGGRVQRWILGLVALGGCGVNEENWSDKLAKAECSFAERCDAATFWYTYEDASACVDEKFAAYSAGEAELVGCTFVKDAAKDCLDALGASCKVIGREYEARVAACYAVWDCGGASRDSFDTGPRAP